MQKITIFGKGGIGKSTLSANLAAVYAKRGKKVILVGCDPKHDTTISLTDGKPIRTVVEQSVFMDASGGDLSKILARAGASAGRSTSSRTPASSTRAATTSPSSTCWETWSAAASPPRSGKASRTRS